MSRDRLLTALISQAKRSTSNTLPHQHFGADVNCSGLGSPLTSSQQQLCKKHLELFQQSLPLIIKEFQRYCQHHFQHERWNCKNIHFPLFEKPQPFLTLGEFIDSY